MKSKLVLLSVLLLITIGIIAGCGGSGSSGGNSVGGNGDAPIGDIPGNLQFDGSTKFVSLWYYLDYSDISPTDYHKYSVSAFSKPKGLGGEDGAMIPGSKVLLTLLQYSNWFNLDNGNSEDVTSDYPGIQFYSTNPEVIKITKEVDTVFSSESKFYATALKTGKATIYAVYDGNKYAYTNVDVAGFIIAFDRATFNSFGAPYSCYNHPKGSIGLNYNGQWYTDISNSVFGAVHNDIIYAPSFVNRIFESNGSKFIIPLKVVPVSGADINSVTWTQTPVEFTGYTVANDFVTITTTDNGKTLQIAFKTNAKGVTIIKGTANDGTSYSFALWMMNNQ